MANDTPYFVPLLALQRHLYVTREQLLGTLLLPHSTRRPYMLPACRTASEAYAIPTFDIVPSDVEGFMEELWAFQSAFHDCFARSEPRAHFFDYMVGQFSKLERKSIEPIALQVEGGTIRGLQRFISDVVWDEAQMRWNYHQLVAEEMGDPDGVLMFDETGFVKKGKDPVG